MGDPQLLLAQPGLLVCDVAPSVGNTESELMACIESQSVATTLLLLCMVAMSEQRSIAAECALRASTEPD